MSSYYGVIFPEFWTGRTGRELRERGGKDAQILGLYLASNRHANMLGLYRLQVADVRHETGLGLKAIERAYAASHASEFATFDAQSSFVWVHQMARFRLGLKPGESLKADDNRVAAVNRIYNAIDPNPFLGKFYDCYARTIKIKTARDPQGVVVPFTISSPSKGASEDLISQITDTDQRSEDQRSEDQKTAGSESDGPRPLRAAPSTPTRQAFEHYHHRFLDRYRAKPEYGEDASARNKYAGLMARLLRRHGLAEVQRRIDAYFDSTDRFLADSGHTLGLFFSSDVQTKLVAQASAPAGVSDRTRQNLAARQRLLDRVRGTA